MILPSRCREQVPATASCPQPPDTALPRTVAVAVPRAYTAFCLLHQDRYLSYARERVQDERVSRKVVETALGDLATIWPAVISSSRPAAVVWGLLNTLISSTVHARRGIAGMPVDAVHRVLPAAQADSVILLCRLRLSETQAAELMGVDEWAVTSHLRMAQRNMPGELTSASATSPALAPPLLRSACQ
ncbi:hypothetical protein [Streptomyces antimycoticus]|uniref:hypothetical protein n=1 Tax=Streptomyces antimycoticus TaxID=68175 RepID=UPI00381DC14D